MDSDNDTQGQSDRDESPPKLSLKLPDAGDDSNHSPPPTLSLKKPSGLTSDASSPTPPATLTLKKPNSPSSSSSPAPGALALKKPELTAPQSLGAPGTLSLKKPLEISVEKGANAPLQKLGKHSDPPTTLKLNVPNKGESKLAEPGNLDLKKPSQIIDTSDMDDDGGGLRLRKAAAPDPPPDSAKFDETSVNLALKETPTDNSEKSSSPLAGLQMRKPGESSPESKLAHEEGAKKAGSGLSLKRTESSPSSMPDLTPPGLEVSSPSPAPNQDNETEKPAENDDATSGESKTNAPLKKWRRLPLRQRKRKVCLQKQNFSCCR